MFWLRIAIFAILNRARGSQLFGYIHSTVLGRIVAMGGMALTLAPDWRSVAWVFATLMLWCSPKWDDYWSIELGHSATHSRLYGLMQMTVRQALILPCYLGLAYLNTTNPMWAMTFLAQGLPYYIMGFTKSRYQIPISEYIVGGIIGLTVGMLYVG